jgi:hypothetical protein
MSGDFGDTCHIGIDKHSNVVSFGSDVSAEVAIGAANRANLCAHRFFKHLSHSHDNPKSRIIPERLCYIFGLLAAKDEFVLVTEFPILHGFSSWSLYPNGLESWRLF